MCIRDRPCPAPELPDYHDNLATLCHIPPASKSLEEILKKIYMNQLALCYYPEVAVTCECVPLELGENQATQKVSSSEVAAGYNIKSERGADTGECDVIEGNFCQKHKSKLIEQKVRVRKWKLCKSGT